MKSAEEVLNWLNSKCRLILQDPNTQEFFVFPNDWKEKVAGKTLQEAVEKAMEQGR